MVVQRPGRSWDASLELAVMNPFPRTLYKVEMEVEKEMGQRGRIFLG